MIKKKYRLKERDVKKVLQKWKPFFSYGVVLNYIQNKRDYCRFAIILWWKSVVNNVERNFVRRRFYDICAEKIPYLSGFDFVFVVKKNKKFEKKDLESMLSFRKDINFLFKKIESFTK